MILNSEQTILGAILMNPAILPRVKQRVKATDFLNQKNRLIYNAINKITKAGYMVEPSAVASETGDTDYLAGIVRDVSTSTGW